MKKIFLFTILLVSFSLFSQTGIGTTSPHASAALDVTSTTKGFLPPRMNSAQMNAIATPAQGLMVYCTDCNPAGLYTNSGSAWEAVGTSSGGSNSSGGVTASLAFATGTYIWGASSTRTIVITIENHSLYPLAWSNLPTDLVLTGNSGFTISTPAATSIPIDGTGTITFNITGAVGTMDDITATWSKGSLTLADTQFVTGGSATFTNAINNAFVFSANASGVNVAGTLPIGTTVAVPYTSGVGKYAAYTSTDVAIPSAHCADGATTWTFGYSYPAGTFGTSGTITATLITKKNGVVTAWPAPQVFDLSTILSDVFWSFIVVNGVSMQPASIGIDYGGDAIRGQLSTRGPAYDAAAVNSWVSITLAEYNLLAVNVPGVSKRLLSTLNYAENSVGSGSNTIVPAYPASNNLVLPSTYVFALSVKSGSTGVPARFSNCVVRYNSTTPTGSFSLLGTSGLLPSHHETPAASTIYAYVLKRPTNISSSSANTYISFFLFSTTDNIALYGSSSSYNFYSKSGNNASMSSASLGTGVTPLIQVLATPTKSW